MNSRGARGGGKRDSNGARRSEPSFHEAGARTRVSGLPAFGTLARCSRGVICFTPGPCAPFETSANLPAAAAGYGLDALLRPVSLSSPISAINEGMRVACGGCDTLGELQGDDCADAIRSARVGLRRGSKAGSASFPTACSTATR